MTFLSRFLAQCSVSLKSLAISASTVLLANLICPAFALADVSQVGFERIRVRLDTGVVAQGGVWFPSFGATQPQQMGLWSVDLVPGGPVAGHGLGLVVLSHGSGGHFTSHFDTAVELARAGFVVAALNHPGDNALDGGLQGTRQLLEARPRQLSRLIDHMLKSWRGSSAIAPGRIGAFGFSAGGHAVLVSIGAQPDYKELASHCQGQTHEPLCRILGAQAVLLCGATPSDGDPRIKAAAVAAPAMGFTIPAKNFQALAVRLQVWAASSDDLVPYKTNAAHWDNPNSSSLTVRVVEGAGHMSFLPACSPGQPDANPAIEEVCTDPPGFDRHQFKEEFNREVVQHFRNALPLP